jgi:hypothetical protein
LAGSSDATVSEVHGPLLTAERIVCIECHDAVAHVYEEATPAAAPAGKAHATGSPK